jgi:spore maturation protein CgeB
MKVVYSFYKRGEEGEGWARDIRDASNDRFTFIPFNQVGYLGCEQYLTAPQLDRLYCTKHPSLMRLCADFERLVKDEGVDAVVVCDAPPFHPDFLRELPIYKVLYSHDDPESTYARNIPYLHVYNHVFYVTPAYTDAMDMAEKMKDCGMINADLVPNGTLSFDYDPKQTKESLFRKKRDIDILFVGAFYRPKVEVMARLKKTFGERFQWYGYAALKHNLYMTVRYRTPFHVRPVSFAERVVLHQRARIGINAHNGYTVPNLGNQRLFYVPANGAMLLTDGARHFSQFYGPNEAVPYQGLDDMIRKIRYYLDHEDERLAIAQAGHDRVMRDYRFVDVTRRAGGLIERGMSRVGWKA